MCAFAKFFSILDFTMVSLMTHQNLTLALIFIRGHSQSFGLIWSLSTFQLFDAFLVKSLKVSMAMVDTYFDLNCLTKCEKVGKISVKIMQI